MIIRIIILPSLFFLFLSNLYAQDITGIWNTPGNRSEIKIFKTETCYAGKIVKQEKPFDKNGNPKKDIHNPNPKFRNRLLNGLIIMKIFFFDKKRNKGSGVIYNPENGKTYKMNIELIGENTLE
ncbi:MAG: DUF2147 domain-containing protein, partial [Chlorobi bacterium]|nr:DUF2147 domain-containing protein [Chlorobiota bacterium]